MQEMSPSSKSSSRNGIAASLAGRNSHYPRRRRRPISRNVLETISQSADNELNATYQQLLKRAAGNPRAVGKIKAAQRAWLIFRDAQIEAFYPADDKQKEYGTVFPMRADLLLADLTRQRTKMLKEMLNSVEGDVCRSGTSR